MIEAKNRVRLLGRRVLLVAILILVGLAPEVAAQTKTLTFMVKDFSGGLASSQASPSAPLLDSNFVQNPLFNFTVASALAGGGAACVT